MTFEPFPKIPRLNRDITITEKIDGTNAAILITDLDETGVSAGDWILELDTRRYTVQAQSRKRIITPAEDNFGFARWVTENAVDLVRLLGPGRHFGEWWGQGIQRGYGLDHKVFSLFNPTFHFGVDGGSFLLDNGEIDVVPVLYEGPFSETAIRNSAALLRTIGSHAAPGFGKPEGIIIYHQAARQLFKVTLEGDEAPKSAWT